MKKDLREVNLAPSRASAKVAIDIFTEKYGAKYDKAVECLTKDHHTLLALYDFPAEHRDQLRTTNPIESAFATPASVVAVAGRVARPFSCGRSSPCRPAGACHFWRMEWRTSRRQSGPALSNLASRPERQSLRSGRNGFTRSSTTAIG